jgi:class 3 adenylate cyclase
MEKNFTHISHTSMERLELLIKKRLENGADKENIDKRIWDLFGEDWSIMFTDLAGFSREVEKFGIIHFLQIIYESKRLFLPIIDKHDGILVKMEGDSMLVIFRNPFKALSCAIEMQKESFIYNQKKIPEEKVLLCVGLGYGKILKIGDTDVFGAEVNASSKLGEDIAKEREILCTLNFMETVNKLTNIDFMEIEEIPPGAKKAFKINYSI